MKTKHNEVEKWLQEIEEVKPLTKPVFEIQNDVPFPEIRGRDGNKYPIKDMKVGSSFFVPGKMAAQISGSVAVTAGRLGFKLSLRTRVENGVSGCRVWRIR